MRKILCVLCLVCLVASLCLTVGCTTNKMDLATKEGNNYSITIGYDNENQILSATQRVEYTNRTANCFETVKLHIYANAYREDAQNPVVTDIYKNVAYPNGQSFGDICFDSVKVDGVAVAYVIEGQDMDILSVPVGELFPDECVEIEMIYQITLANIQHRLGYTQNTVNLGNFFPIVCVTKEGNFDTTPYFNYGDPFVSDVANYEVSITLPSDFVVASTGQLTEATNNENSVTYCYVANAVRDFAMSLSNKYKKLSQTVGDTTINYYYFADTQAEASLQTTVECFEYFSKNIGKYPYSQFSVCETDFCYGGMEYPQIVFVTSGSTAYQEAIVHETAHQWFYGVVGNDQIANAWMDEGLTEFVTYLFLDDCDKAKLSTKIHSQVRQYTNYVDVLNNYYTNVDTTFRPLCDYSGHGEYVMITYVKGCLMFDTIYEGMGATKFYKALSHYYTNYKFCIATPQNMIDSFCSVGSQYIANIFTAFAEGKEVIGKVTD